MAQADGVSVGIGKVDVADVLASQSYRLGHVGFLDIHVEPIGQQSRGAKTCDAFHSGLQAIALVGFVAIEGFVEDGATDIGSVLIEAFQSLSESPPGAIERHVGAGATLHGTDDRGGLELRCSVEDALDELDGFGSLNGARVRQAESMSHPASARSHGGHRHALIAQDLADGGKVVAGLVEKFRSGRENLHGIKAQLLCQRDAWGEISPEHKWAPLGFGNKRKGDRRTHFHWVICILRGVFIISSFVLPSYPQHFSREFRAVPGRLWVF